MDDATHRSKLGRRTFLKLGTFGAAAAVTGRSTAEEPSSPAGATDKPPQRTLGRTGLKVAMVGMGAMRTSEPAVMQAAFERGVNYIDTARCYMGGENENIVGKALKGYRDKVIVATKFHKPGPKEEIVKSVEESLKALQTDHIDVLQMHKPAKEEVLHEESKEALALLREQGKIRFTGITTHKDMIGVIDTMLADPDKFYDMVLVTYNFTCDQSPELRGDKVKDLAAAIERAAKANLGVVAMKTQAGGYATKELGDISPHQAALKWVLQNPNITCAVPAMIDLQQVMEDTEVMGMPLSRTEEQVLSRYRDAIRPYYCRGCDSCGELCPNAVDICTINRSLMYAEGYKDMELARNTYGSIPRAHTAAACGDCAACVARCPYGVNIEERMGAARAAFA